jgi:hypothetical protein
MNTPRIGTKSHARLVRKLARAYARAIRAEENAPTLDQAYRLAKVSERCLRRLQAAQAGLPLPEPRLPDTARNRAKRGLAALAAIGRLIARAFKTAANLRKAQATNAARKVARQAARLVRQALRRVGLSLARRALALVPVTTTKKEIIVMKAPKLAAHIHAGQGHNYCQVSVDSWGLLQFTDDTGRFRLVTELRGDRFVFSGGIGEHSIAADETITSAPRLLAHWQGYVDNTVRAFAEAAHRRVGLGPLTTIQAYALATVLRSGGVS